MGKLQKRCLFSLFSHPVLCKDNLATRYLCISIYSNLFQAKALCVGCVYVLSVLCVVCVWVCVDKFPRPHHLTFFPGRAENDWSPSTTVSSRYHMTMHSALRLWGGAPCLLPHGFALWDLVLRISMWTFLSLRSESSLSPTRLLTPALFAHGFSGPAHPML